MKKSDTYLALLIVLCACGLPAGQPVLAAERAAAQQPELTNAHRGWLAKANRHEKAGWIYLHIEGQARERGFQHGYLLAKEIDEALRATRKVWEYESAMDWTWLVGKAKATAT